LKVCLQLDRRAKRAARSKSVCQVLLSGTRDAHDNARKAVIVVPAIPNSMVWVISVDAIILGGYLATVATAAVS
jgi:hypothetical protein